MRPTRTPRHFNWILPAALLLGSFTAMAQDRPRPVGAATSEKLTPFRKWMRSLGVSRHTSANDQGILITESSLVGPRRSYQKWKDGTGHEFELYLENGQVRPVDEEVKRWVETALREGVPPPPPAPPALPAIPEPPAIPSLPSLSEAHHPWSESDWGREIQKRVQGDARLEALLGSPISMAPWEGRAHVNTWEKGEPHGFALFSSTGGKEVEAKVPIAGPKGAALLRVKAQLGASGWTFSKLEAQPGEGSSRMNLLAK